MSSPGPCIRCGATGPWDNARLQREHPEHVDEVASEWRFDGDEDDEPFSKPVCPDCTTWDDRWKDGADARKMIADSRAAGRELSLNEKGWEGELAEIAAHIKLDREEYRRIFGD